LVCEKKSEIRRRDRGEAKGWKEEERRGKEVKAERGGKKMKDERRKQRKVTKGRKVTESNKKSRKVYGRIGK
jgi:hypothetical protein